MPVVLGAYEGAVCRVQLNRPDKLNALSDQVRQELHAILADLADRPEIRVVVIEGKGRAFSAGADLAGPAGRAARTAGTAPAGGAASTRAPAVSSSEWAVRRHAMGGWQRLLDLLESIPQVTLARLHGHCIGGAALLASACDLRIGDTT